MTGESELRFTFEGRSVTAQPGQSIAGALHATGVRTLSRGVKYHRPRGYTCGFGACGDCPLQIDGMPSTVSCTTPVRGGEQVRREGGLPSVRFDLLRTADLMRPMLKAGFQFSLFAGQPRLSKLAGTLLAVLAGGGRAPSAAAAERSTVTRVERLSPDVLVIGAGVSGLTTALAAADAGAEVILVDQEHIGGRARVRTEPVHTVHGPALPAGLVADLLERVSSHTGIRVLRGIAIGITEGLIPVINEREQLRSEIRPEALILATGSYETPVLVPGHDLPGVMLADGALRLTEIEGVRPGRRAVIIAGDDRADDVARALQRSGVEIVASVPAEHVQRVTGWARATGVQINSGVPGVRRYRADLVCVVGPRRAASELELHAAYADAGSHELVTSDAAVSDLTDARSRFAIVGSAAGSASYDLAHIARTARDIVRSVQHDREHARALSTGTDRCDGAHTASPHSGVNKGERP